MRKIPTLFARNPDDRRHVLDQVTPGCEWVLNGEGVATRKYDGTCVRIKHLWHDGPQVAVDVRREVKPGKNPPEHFEAVDHDDTTGKTVGWEPYGQSGFARFVEEALGNLTGPAGGTDHWPEGTYELIGPKINGNPEHVERHELVAHGRELSPTAPRDFDGLRDWLLAHDDEGIVWHHPDGRMCKLKRRDFQPERAS